MQTRTTGKYINRLQSLLRGIKSSELMSDRLTMQDHYQLCSIAQDIYITFNRMDQYLPSLRIDRLRKFANHLDAGKLVHKFKGCDSTYFAEYPILFPEHWKVVRTGAGQGSIRYLPIECSRYDGTMFFFGLTNQQYRHLFFTYNQNKEWGDIRLTDRSGLKTWVNHINQFCDHFEKGGLHGL